MIFSFLVLVLLSCAAATTVLSVIHWAMSCRKIENDLNVIPAADFNLHLIPTHADRFQCYSS